jgi:hypothetical protein
MECAFCERRAAFIIRRTAVCFNCRGKAAQQREFADGSKELPPGEAQLSPRASHGRPQKEN